MGWVNFHNHTRYCDGTADVSDYAIEALKLNMRVLGFSGHAPVPWKTTWNMTGENLERYLADVAKAKESFEGEMEIYRGLEVDYVPGLTHHSSYFKEMGIDFLIASIHFAGVFANGSPCEMDGPHDHFLQGVNDIFGGDSRARVGKTDPATLTDEERQAALDSFTSLREAIENCPNPQAAGDPA